jgi:hypothetical protein
LKDPEGILKIFEFHLKDYLLRILQLLDPSFNASNLRSLLEDAKKFYIETWSVESSYNLSDKNLDFFRGYCFKRSSIFNY